MIEKVIHYCWFGKNKKPNIVNKCINTWVKYLKGYKIIEWNEESFDINMCSFTKEAYKDKKWAFVSDYCRLWVLYNYGGIYLDTDIEVLKPLDDLLDNNCFGGLEDEQINLAIWGCKKEDKFLEEVLKYYSNLNYLDYKERLQDLAIPIHITNVATKLGYIKPEDSISYFYNDVAIYPKEYFYPKRHAWEEPKITENTYTIHHYEGTWRKPHQILRSKTKEKLLNII
uniref:glycosyltransferase family 32 protein n=1 Tax=Clostridium sp. TaxID=1506 RepID=UPI00262028F6